MTHAIHTNRLYHTATGFTLIEAVMSILIVGLMLVAALNTVGASKIAQSLNAEQTLGPMLAEELMSEILEQRYKEEGSTFEYGQDSGESGSARTHWDDVDDYDGWSASPPEDKEGTAIPDTEGWERSVTVQMVSSTDPNVLESWTYVKRIDVIVLHKGRVITTFSALRTIGWPDQ